MTISDIYLEVCRRGLWLKPEGGMLKVVPEGCCPADFADVLRQHEGELLDLCEARAADLPDDCGPWLGIARRILAHEFEKCDSSTRKSLTLGLRNIRHELCQAALAELKRKRKR
jgi:hypothetical protein